MLTQKADRRNQRRGSKVDIRDSRTRRKTRRPADGTVPTPTRAVLGAIDLETHRRVELVIKTLLNH